MEIEKRVGTIYGWFYYCETNDGVLHGLRNNNNRFIGYFYKENEKGFWLEKYKR